MIESIEIKNFRCFKDTKIAKFGLVNLFGGLNNAGKTALLEAIYLITTPSPDSVMFLQRIIRRERAEFTKGNPEKAWDNLYYQQDKSKPIFLNSSNEKKNINKIILQSSSKEVNNFVDFNEENIENEDIFKLDNALSVDFLSEKNTLESTLHLKNGEFSSMLIANKDGVITPKDSTVKTSMEKSSYFIPASTKLSSDALATEFSKAKLNYKEELILQAFQIIDNTIEKIDIIFIGKAVLHLKRIHENYMPLSLFGDAINKIADFILRIINNPNSTVLIDEIENGVHYTNQEKLWKMLFDLAIEFNVQIFATTHSYEMARAFVNVIKENQFNEKAGYFELARHAKTGNVIGTSIPIDILDYDVENNFPFRGE